jgi:hypothetical protein
VTLRQGGQQQQQQQDRAVGAQNGHIPSAVMSPPPLAAGACPITASAQLVLVPWRAYQCHQHAQRMGSHRICEGLRLRDLFECLASRAYPYAGNGELAALLTPEAKFCSKERSDRITPFGLAARQRTCKTLGYSRAALQGIAYLCWAWERALVRAWGALLAAHPGRAGRRTVSRALITPQQPRPGSVFSRVHITRKPLL